MSIESFESEELKKSPEQIIKESLSAIEQRIATMPEEIHDRIEGRSYTRADVRHTTDEALKIVPFPNEDIPVNSTVRAIPLVRVRSLVIKVLEARRKLQP